MGVIKRQSIKQSLITYLGIVIGAISTLFVYPRMDLSELGEIQFVLGTAIFLAPFMGVGLPAVAIHFFPYFKDSKTSRGRFFYILSGFTFLSIVIYIPIVYISQHIISRYFSTNAYLFINYLPYILGLASCITFINLLQSYISNFSRIVIPSILYNLTLKIVQPIIIILYLGSIISFYGILNGLILVHFLIVLATFYYLYYLGYWEINFQKIHTSHDLKKQIVDYSIFSILTYIGGSLALQIDKFLIGIMVGTRSLAIFTIPVLITEAIDVVRKALSGVAAPIISDSIKVGDIDNVEMIYKKSALLQFTIGLFLLISAWTCADDLYNIMPKGKEFAEGKILIMILGVSRLIDMLTGANTEIIAYSKHYRANLYMLLFLSVVNIVSNCLLIPQYGNVGAAYATLISMFLFNAIKLVFIYSKMSIHPFSKNMLGAFLIGSVIFVMANNIPAITINNWGIIPLSIFRIALKGLLITSVYFLLIWKFNISQDINSIIQGVFLKVKGWVKTS